jgi:predicted DNA-binding helix-hairpin-helix protein
MDLQRKLEILSGAAKYGAFGAGSDTEKQSR